MLEIALWPNTWLSVRVIESGEKVKVRTSNIMLLADYESDKYKDLRATAAQAALLAPPGSKKPLLGRSVGPVGDKDGKYKGYSIAKKKKRAKRGPKKGYLEAQADAAGVRTHALVSAWAALQGS